MRYGKSFVFFITLLLTIAAALIGISNVNWEAVPLSAEVFNGAEVEEIACWESEDGRVYLFLPSYAEISRVKLRLKPFEKILLDGQVLTDGTTCEAYPVGVPITLSYSVWGHTYEKTLQLVQSENVATIHVDVASGNMDYIHREKGNQEAGNLRVYTTEGLLDYSGNLEYIRGRGNATWDADKKAYSLSLYQEADLLGMGKAGKWILLANAYDDSMIRNKIVYDMAETAGMAYTPNTEWADVYFNGVYAGLYLLCERNEIHQQRVDLTGRETFLVSKELHHRVELQDDPYIITDNRMVLRIHDSTMSQENLTDIWQKVENAVLEKDGIDPETGKLWSELIDLDSWARKYVFEELFGNHDGGYISQFFYYDADDLSGKIYAGPIWDFDISMGCKQWIARNPQTMVANKPYYLYKTDRPLFYALYQKDSFYQRVTELYAAELRPLLDQLLETELDAYADHIFKAFQANQLRWSESTELADAVAHIRSYLQARIAFLDELWIENVEYCFVQVDGIVDEMFWVNFAVRKGDSIADLPEFENTIDTVNYAWYYQNSGEPVDFQAPVSENIVIYREEK